MGAKWTENPWPAKMRRRAQTHPQTHHLDPRMIYLQYMGLPLIQTLYILDTKVKKTVGYYVK